MMESDFSSAMAAFTFTIDVKSNSPFEDSTA